MTLRGLRANGAVAAEAGVALVVAGIAVRVLPGPKTTRLLGEVRTGAPDEATARELAEARRIGAIVERVAGKLPWHPVCLPQAIATRWLLRRRHIRCDSHVGITSTQPLEAHAWVSVGDVVVQGGPVQHAAELGRFR